MATRNASSVYRQQRRSGQHTCDGLEILLSTATVDAICFFRRNSTPSWQEHVLATELAVVRHGKAVGLISHLPCSREA